MKAIAHFKCLPVENPDALVEIDLPEPVPGPRDLLVEVKAVSVNPVDTKVRQGYVPHTDETQPRILGWDAAGVVKSVGSDVTLFKPGDKVWYAGSLIRPGSNSELQLVDICRAPAGALQISTVAGVRPGRGASPDVSDRLGIAI